jgi:hypothetical protein
MAKFPSKNHISVPPTVGKGSRRLKSTVISEATKHPKRRSGYDPDLVQRALNEIEENNADGASLENGIGRAAEQATQGNWLGIAYTMGAVLALGMAAGTGVEAKPLSTSTNKLRAKSGASGLVTANGSQSSYASTSSHTSTAEKFFSARTPKSNSQGASTSDQAKAQKIKEQLAKVNEILPGKKLPSGSAEFEKTIITVPTAAPAEKPSAKSKKQQAEQINELALEQQAEQAGTVDLDTLTQEHVNGVTDGSNIDMNWFYNNIYTSFATGAGVTRSSDGTLGVHANGAFIPSGTENLIGWEASNVNFFASDDNPSGEGEIGFGFAHGDPFTKVQFTEVSFTGTGQSLINLEGNPALSSGYDATELSFNKVNGTLARIKVNGLQASSSVLYLGPNIEFTGFVGDKVLLIQPVDGMGNSTIINITGQRIIMETPLYGEQLYLQFDSVASLQLGCIDDINYLGSRVRRAPLRLAASPSDNTTYVGEVDEVLVPTSGSDPTCKVGNCADIEEELDTVYAQYNLVVGGTTCSNVSNTPSPTASVVITASSTGSSTRTPSTTSTISLTATVTPTPTASTTNSRSNTPSTTSSLSSTPTSSTTSTTSDSATGTSTSTPSPSQTSSRTSSQTRTRTPTPTTTLSLTATQTSTESLVVSMSITSTETSTSTPSPTFGFSFSMTPTTSATSTTSGTSTPTTTNTSTNTPTSSSSSTPSSTSTPVSIFIAKLHAAIQAQPTSSATPALMEIIREHIAPYNPEAVNFLPEFLGHITEALWQSISSLWQIDISTYDIHIAPVDLETEMVASPMPLPTPTLRTTRAPAAEFFQRSKPAEQTSGEIVLYRQPGFAAPAA